MDLDDVELLQGERMLRVVDVSDQVEDFALIKVVLKTKRFVVKNV